SFSSSNRSIAFPSADGVQATTGGMTADVGIITAPVAVATPVTIFATYGGVTKSAVLTVMPPPTALADLQVSPSIVVSGALASGTATVSAAAAAGGTVVSLVSSHPAVVAVPANVTVPPGSTTASFAVTTNTVTLSTVIVTISGTSGGVTRSVQLTVMPPGVSSVTLDPATVPGGSASTGTVILNSTAATGGTVVTLNSTNAAAATVPVSVLVAAGPAAAG